MDRALDQLEAAMLGVGLPPLAAPDSLAPLADIETEIAPLSLPADLRRFWQRVAIPSLAAVRVFPSFIGPSYALDSYRELQAWGRPDLLGPPLLFPVAYSSHCHRSVELVSSWHEGGGVFFWVNDNAEAFRVQYWSLTELIVSLAELVEAEAFDDRGERHGHRYVSIDSRAEEQKQAAGLLIAGSHRLYGDSISVGNELPSWPAHWLASAGIDLADRSPRGASHTIADALTDAVTGPLRARISGTVVRLVGTGDGMRVLVDDGSGVLDVACPQGTSPWGPTMRRAFEFDVVVERPEGPRPEYERWHQEIQTHALHARHEQAVAATTELQRQLQERPAQATATAIRPLD